MTTMRRAWNWLQSIPILGWAMAVIAVLAGALWVMYRGSQRDKARAQLLTERRQVEVKHQDEVAAAAEERAETITQIDKERAASDEELDQRAAAIDAASAESAEASAANWDRIMLRRKRRRERGE